MKKILFILAVICSLTASAQIDTTKPIPTIAANGYAYKHLQAIYAMIFPGDTLSKLKSTWRGIAFQDTLPYFWTGKAYRTFGTGTGGSTDTTSLSNRINLKLNITDTANKWITAVRRSADSVYYQKGGTWTFAYKDSTGGSGSADGYVDSVRFNSATNILTVYQNTASDQSVYLPPSHLNFDSSYTPLGGMRNDSTGIIKSVRIRRNSVTVTPTQVGDSAMYWDISVPTTYVDSVRRSGVNVQVYKNGAWENAYTDSVGSGGGGVSDTSVFIIDTLYNRLAHVINTDSLRLKSLQMQVNGSTVTPTETDSTLSYNIIDNSIDTTIYNSDGVISSDRAINGDSKSISFNTFRKFYAETDSLQIYLNSGYINISGINDGGTLSDSILVVSVDGDVKKMSSDRVGTSTMQQVLDAEGGNAILTGNPDFGPDEDLSAELSFGDTYLWNRISMYSGSYRFLANDLNHQTDIIIHADSIALNPSNGYMNIDSLRQGTSNDSVLVWNKQTGIVGYRNASAFGGGGSSIDTTTVPLVTFTAGAGFAADTAMVTDSSLFGSLFTGQYEYTITKIQAVIKGNSGDSVVLMIVYNDSFNVLGTKVTNAGLSVSSRVFGNTFDVYTNRTVPANQWLWMKPEAVIAGKKPKYISVTLLGYKTYVAP